MIVNTCPAAVTVALRADVVVFEATEKLTVPLPDPLAPAVMVTHDTASEAVQAQPDVVVTLKLPVPPACGIDWLVGEIENVQPAAASVAVNVWPAIVAVPDRVVVAVFAAMLRLTVPLPEPLAPPVTVIQDALLPAVHEHPAGAVTLTVPVPPAAGSDWLSGVIV